jgi:heavy metal translocating P-type ATPase
MKINLTGFLKDGEKRTLLFLAVSLVGLLLSFFKPFPFPIDLAWITILFCGLPIIKNAITGLVTRFDVKADILVSLALIASVIIGEHFAAGEVAFIMTIGSYLEERTVRKTRAGIEKLILLTPRTARVVRDNGETIVLAEEVRPGDILRVLAGETIAVDGVITSGQTSVDQSIMTGESLPADKGPGDNVQSGTVNQYGAFEMKAQKTGEDSSIQRMIRLVESADAGKAKIVGAADRWATWIVVAALATACITWIFTKEIIRSVTILVVFCPCALVLATPTAIMAGIGNAARYGILVRMGSALECLAKVKRITFDKTGTLTLGKPAVVLIQRCEDAGPTGIKEDTAFLELFAAAELYSEHPLGKAIVSFYRQITGASPKAPESFHLLPGRGVWADIGGQEVLAGNMALFEKQKITIRQALMEKAGQMQNEGCTVLFLALNREVQGMIALADTLRPACRNTIKQIVKTGTKITLLTGDTPPAAQHIADLAGIDEVYSECLPEDKLKIIQQFQAEGEEVCMVGDGINDAPALKTAYIGIAMGGIGSDIAIEAADIALVSDNIDSIPHLLRLSKKLMKTINLNIIASLALNFIAIILAFAGILNPILGALVHNAGSVAVVINSSLILKWKEKAL